MKMSFIEVLFSVFLVFVFLFLFFYRFIFLRDPERIISKGRNIVSPADGKVIMLKRIKRKEGTIRKGLFGRINVFFRDVAKDGYIISIFMGPFDVHVNRAPMSGVVLNVKYNEGKFFIASRKKSLLNECNEILMKTEVGKIKVIQIAGFFARKIVCFVKEKQKLNKGERIGKIILGSQVSLILPSRVKILVKKGDVVRAGETILAEY